MKKGVLLSSFLLSLFLLASVSAISCKPTLTIVNQDPYPAIPGEEVKVVFELSDILNKECGEVFIKVEDTYPFTLDPSSERIQKVNAGLYDDDYSRSFLGHYKLRIDEDALEGDNKIVVNYGQSSGLQYKEEFNINLDETRTEFDFSIVSYSATTKELVFDMLNVGENNVDAIVLEMPKQEGITIYGKDKLVVGDLDSDEDERITFVLDLEKDNLDLKISYTDTSDHRRVENLNLMIDKESLLRQVQPEEASFFNASFVYGIVVALILAFIWSYYKKKKSKKKNRD